MSLALLPGGHCTAPAQSLDGQGRAGQGGFLAHLTSQTLEGLAGHCSKRKVYFGAAEVGGSCGRCLLQVLQIPHPSSSKPCCARAGAVAAWGLRQPAQGQGGCGYGQQSCFFCFFF